MGSNKWKYPDPRLTKNVGERWYDDVPDDEELEKYLGALLRRHTFGGDFAHDAALVPVLMKLVYLWKEKK